jgi:hypothetical protein
MLVDLKDIVVHEVLAKCLRGAVRHIDLVVRPVRPLAVPSIFAFGDGRMIVALRRMQPSLRFLRPRWFC